MSIATETAVQFPTRRAIGQRGRKRFDAMAAELQAALVREQKLVNHQQGLAQRQLMLSQEFEHRLVNGLQIVVSLLSLQSRTATTPEAAAQLTIASRRVRRSGACITACISSIIRTRSSSSSIFSTYARTFRVCCSRYRPVARSKSMALKSRYRPPRRSRSASS